jgi:hypothetical protein
MQQTANRAVGFFADATVRGGERPFDDERVRVQWLAYVTTGRSIVFTTRHRTSEILENLANIRVPPSPLSRDVGMSIQNMH